MAMKALLVGFEQLVALSILLTSILLVSGLLVNHYLSSVLNYNSAMGKLSAYYEMQQVAYAMAAGNSYPMLQTGNSIKIASLSVYGPGNHTCSMNYTANKGYVCGIAAYSGKLYIIRVYQNG